MTPTLVSLQWSESTMQAKAAERSKVSTEPLADEKAEPPSSDGKY